MLRRVVALAFILTTVQMSMSRQQGGGKPSQPLGAGNPNALPAPLPPVSTKRTRELVFSVDGQSNPLREVATQLSQQFGIPISYEEPAWIAGPELMRTIDTPEARNNSKDIADKINPKMKSSAPGSIQLHATTQDGQDDVQFVGKVLRDILSDHSSRHNPGEFKILKLGDYGYSIVPTNVRGDKNQWISAGSPFDA